jgi:hypothetical protein
MMIGFLFSAVAAIGSGVAFFTGEKVPDMTDSIQSRAIRRR